MVREEVVYLVSGPGYLPYVVTSIKSLRNHYNGTVSVYTWPESTKYVKQIQKDNWLGIDVIEREPEYRGKNAQFIDKQKVMMGLSSDVGLYLDADTLIRAPITPLFLKAYECGFLATQFGNWTTKGGVVQNRIERLLQFPDIPPDLIWKSINDNIPSVNGGVFSCRPDSEVLPLWHTWSYMAKSIFISDETALHVICRKFLDQPDKLRIYEGGAFNCSPRYQPKNLDDSQIAIWHGHGNSFAREGKSKRGVAMWLAEFDNALAANTGYMADWYKTVVPANKHLKETLGDRL